MRPCHSRQDGVADRGPQVRDRRTQDARDAPRLGFLDVHEQSRRRIIQVRDNEPVQPAAARVEHVAGSFRGDAHVGHERNPWEAQLEQADSLEVGWSVGI